MYFIFDHEGKIEHPVCQYCGKQLSTPSALKLHIDTACPEKPEPPKKRKQKQKKSKNT